MKEIGLKRDQAILYGDNQSAVAAAKNGVRTERAKHIDIKYHFITDVVERGKMRLEWIPTKEQKADILTKALDASQFATLRKLIMTA